ncbi:MAG: HTTM domain-containing protein [Anaerolineales bacterium]|nr:HTTM domain-containing protein [Anaerolineales bacterium]
MENRIGTQVWDWRYWFGLVDNRPVAIFRIAFGLILLKDAIYHLFIADLFFSDKGITPPQGSFVLWPPEDFSLFFLHDSLAWAYVLILVWIGVTIALILGWQVRWAAILNWLIVVSVQERSPLIINGADVVMSVMSFWMMFLPLAEQYSLASRGRPRNRYSYALPIRLAQLQVALIYFQTTITKMPGGTWFDGNAVHYALNMTFVTSPVTDWVLSFLPAWAFVGIGWLTWIVELWFIIWLYFPWGQPRIRLVTLVSGYLLHLGIGVLMAVPNFSWIMMASYFLWWDGEWVGKLVKLVRRYGPFPARPASLAAPDYQPVAGLRLGGRLLSSAFLLYTMFCVVWLLGRGAFGTNVPAVTGVSGSLIRAAGLAQRWIMFSFGDTPGTDVWIAVVGEYEDGQLWDIQRDVPFDGTRHRWLIGPTARFKKFEENLREERAAAQPWAEYACRQGAKSGPDSRLVAVEVQLFQRVINDLGDPAGVYQPTTVDNLYRLECP